MAMLPLHVDAKGGFSAALCPLATWQHGLFTACHICKAKRHREGRRFFVLPCCQRAITGRKGTLSLQHGVNMAMLPAPGERAIISREWALCVNMAAMLPR
jgi:hypothetical protein